MFPTRSPGVLWFGTVPHCPQVVLVSDPSVSWDYSGFTDHKARPLSFYQTGYKPQNSLFGFIALIEMAHRTRGYTGVCDFIIQATEEQPNEDMHRVGSRRGLQHASVAVTVECSGCIPPAPWPRVPSPPRLVMSNKRCSHRSGNPRGFRSSGTGIRIQDQMHAILFCNGRQDECFTGEMQQEVK